MKKIIAAVSILTAIFLLTGCPNVINYSPELNITDQTVAEGQTLSVNLRDFTSDRNMESLSDKPWDEKEKMTYSLVSGKGEISGYDYIYSPGYTEEGSYTIQIKVTDNWGSVASDSFTLTVTGANATPTMDIPNPPAAVEGELYNMDLSQFATDLDLDDLTFDLLTNEGTITGNTFSFDPDFTSAGTHTITIRVTDSTGASSIYTFKIEVVNVLRTFDLNINTTPASGLDIIINGELFVSPVTKPATESYSYTFRVVLPQPTDENSMVNGDDTGYAFVKWSDGVTENERTVTISSDATCIAEMKREYKAETGTTPAGITAITGSDWYVKNSSASFKAPVATGYTFDHWEINGTNAGTANPISVTIDSPKKIVAVYKINTYSLTVMAENGNVTITPVQSLYEHGTPVTLSAEPEEGYFFSGWYENDQLISKANPAVVTMDSTRTIKAICKNTVLILRDTAPWWGNTAITDCLEEIGINNYEYKDSTWINSQANFDIYPFLIIEGEQEEQFYETYKNNRAKFDSYVSNGGSIFWIVATNTSPVNLLLPGDIACRWYSEYSVNQVFKADDLPISEDFPIDVIYGPPVSFGGFSNLEDPVVASAISDLRIYLKETSTTEKYPTYITYKLGSGTIVASMAPFEYNYAHTSCPDYDYWKVLFKRSIEFPLGLPLSPVPEIVSSPSFDKSFWEQNDGATAVSF